MRMRILGLVLGVLVTTALALPAQAQQASVTYRLFHYEGGNWIEYAANAPLPAGGDQPGTNLWRYTYELCNIGFSTGLYELDMFFNSDDVPCATLSGSSQPANWTATQVGPVAPSNNWRLRYRTLLSGSRVAMGACNSDFSVDFTWVCPSLPGPQNFDAIATSGSYADVSLPAVPLPVRPATWGQVKGLYR
jgi:hypothetical protein